MKKRNQADGWICPICDIINARNIRCVNCGFYKKIREVKNKKPRYEEKQMEKGPIRKQFQ